MCPVRHPLAELLYSAAERLLSEQFVTRLGDRLGVLTSRLLERRETALVYVTLQKTAEEVASHLRTSSGTRRRMPSWEAALGSFYASYQCRLLASEAAVLAGHTPERQAFLKRLLHAGKRGTKWTTLHPDEAAAALGEPRDLERLQGVLDFAGHRGCLTRRLLQYFGEASGDEAVARCGTCTSCHEGVSATAESGGVVPREIPASAVPPLSPGQAAAVRSLVAEGRPSLRTPRQLAWFLCGLTSPATTRERLGRHAAFGLLARVPFAKVLAEAETLLKTAR